MPQRVTLRTPGERVSLSDLEAFVKTCRDARLPSGSMFPIEREEDEKGKVTYTVKAVFPKDVRVIDGKKIKVVPKDRKARKVEKHIKEKSGKGAGYVPPEGRKTRPRRKKVKCPKCGVRKLVVTVSGMKTIKPHVSKGEPCDGSGMQVGVVT